MNTGSEKDFRLTNAERPEDGWTPETPWSVDYLGGQITTWSHAFGWHSTPLEALNAAFHWYHTRFLNLRVADWWGIPQDLFDEWSAEPCGCDGTKWTCHVHRTWPCEHGITYCQCRYGSVRAA